MAADTPKTSRAWLWIALVVIALAGVYAYTHSHGATEVRVATVDREDLVSTISTNGKVEPLEDFQAHASQPSTVQALYVELGEHVTKGEPLLRLNVADADSKVAQAQATVASGNLALNNMERGGTAAELSSSRSDLLAAQAQEASAAASLTTIQNLKAQGAASNAEVVQAQNRLNDAKARVTALHAASASRYTSADIAAQKSANAANQSALFAARSALGSVELRAPFAGTVYSVNVKASEFVPGPEESMLEMADLSRLQVRAYFDEPEIGKLAAGQPVRIVWDARPGRVWHGHVTQPPTTVITYNGTRNVGECLISIDDADGALLPNTNVTVTVTTSHHADVLSLPREALRTLGNEDFVFRVVDGKLVKTDVKVGVLELTRMEIVSGLHQGDVVALGVPLNGNTPAVTLVDGMSVKAER